MSGAIHLLPSSAGTPLRRSTAEGVGMILFLIAFLSQTFHLIAGGRVGITFTDKVEVYFLPAV